MSREEVIMRASALAVARGQSNRFADWDQPAAGRRGHLWATGHHWCAAVRNLFCNQLNAIVL